MNETLLTFAADAPRFAAQLAGAGLLITTVVLGAVWLLSHCSEALRYGILLTGVVGLLLAPLLVLGGQRIAWPTLGAEPEPTVQRIPADLWLEMMAHPQPPQTNEPDGAAEPSVSWVTAGALALLAIWLLGILVGAYRWLLAHRTARRFGVGTVWRPDFLDEAHRARLARRVGLQRFPDVVVSSLAPMPMVVGLFRPRIVLPEVGLANWQPGQWDAVLLHEAAHIARRDPWAAWAQRAAVLAFWWLPLAHWLSRWLSDLRETICDDYAIQGDCDRISYAEVLVESAEQLLRVTNPLPLGWLGPTRGGLEARVARLLDKERKPMTKLGIGGRLLAFSCLAVVCLIATAPAALSGGDPVKTARIQIKIILDGKELDLNDAQIHELLQAKKETQPKKPQSGSNQPAAVPMRPSVPNDPKDKVHGIEADGRITEADVHYELIYGKGDPKLEARRQLLCASCHAQAPRAAAIAAPCPGAESVNALLDAIAKQKSARQGPSMPKAPTAVGNDSTVKKLADELNEMSRKIAALERQIQQSTLTASEKDGRAALKARLEQEKEQTAAYALLKAERDRIAHMEAQAQQQIEQLNGQIARLRDQIEALKAKKREINPQRD